MSTGEEKLKKAEESIDLLLQLLAFMNKTLPALVSLVKGIAEKTSTELSEEKKKELIDTVNKSRMPDWDKL